MWSQFSRSLSLELEYLFTVMAEAALPDQLWLPQSVTGQAGTQTPKPTQH